MATTTTTPIPLRILMLHGYTQSGPLFHAKTRALEKSLEKAFPAPQYALSLHYPTAPIRLHASDIPQHTTPSTTTTDDNNQEAYAWWIRNPLPTPHSPTNPTPATYVYTGLDAGLAAVAATLRAEGPFDGAIGFSQGAALAGMLAALLEPGRRAAFAAQEARGGMPFPVAFMGSVGTGEGGGEGGGPGEEAGEGADTDTDADAAIQAPLRFAVAYSGFGVAENPLYAAFGAPKIATPMLHFIGSVDTVVEEARSLRLVDACVDGRGRDGEARLVYHPGGHFLPASQKQFVGVLVGFIRGVVEDGGRSRETGAVQRNGGTVDDLDVPF